MKKTILRQYARLIATVGVNIQRGQPVIITAQLDQPEFVRCLVEECYRAGASEVEVDWDYQPLAKLHYRWQKQATLDRVKPWQEARLRYRAETLPCYIHLTSEDPDGLTGIDPKKRAHAQQEQYKILKPIRESMENRYQWCIAAVPGERWAKKVFPELPKGRAVEALWEAILSCSRAYEGDPVENWKRHDEDLAARCEALNAMRLVSLEYSAANGTALTVGLIPEALFLGGAEPCMGSGVIYNPNIPSEEVFITPKAGVAEGIVCSSMPLSYQGQIIDNFSLRFENGRVVEAKAERNEEVLRRMVSIDEGASRLGECALVPYDSPIRKSGLLFYNTLLDENAACHLALGRGYTSNIRGYESMSSADFDALGVNSSMIHVDLMIGTEDLAIAGVNADGERIQIFKDGGWAF